MAWRLEGTHIETATPASYARAVRAGPARPPTMAAAARGWYTAAGEVGGTNLFLVNQNIKPQGG